MKDKSRLRQFAVVFALFSLFIVFELGGQFSAYAASFQNHYLSSDGGVKASYDDATQDLNIYGAGTVEYDRWVAMAKRINPFYFGGDDSWDAYTSENDMTISFNGAPKAIKLCGTEVEYRGLFRDFTGDIFFNGAVDLALGVTDTSYMFCGADSFNQPLNFNTSNVTDMSYMFAGAYDFDQALNFDTSNVTDISHMFRWADSFNQPLNFDTANVTDMSYMFFGADSFNQPLNFVTSNVTDMSNMFTGARDFNQQLNFDTGNVTDMYAMFYSATSFDQPLNFDTANVTDMRGMFEDATAYKQSLELDVSSLSDMKSMFENSAIEYVVLKGATAAQSIDATHAFLSCPGLKYLEFEGLSGARLAGFSGDYYVEENGGTPVLKAASAPYTFADNKAYRVYLVDVEAPEIAVKRAGSGIKVSWRPVSGATSYQVYRADRQSGPFKKFKTTGGLVYTNLSKLEPGMPYYYKVRAYRFKNGSYTFGPFSEVKGYYAPGALVAPAQPNLTLDKNAGGIRLNWNAQNRITGYQVFRAVSTDKPFSYLKTASGSATKYTNLAGLTQGRPYYYKIRAYRMAKGVRKYGAFSTIKGMFAGTNEPALSAVSFSLEDNPNVTAPNVRVRWSALSGAGGYCIYRWDGFNKRWTGLKKTGPSARVYTNVNGVVNNKTHFYAMRTYHASGGVTYYGNIGQAKGYKVTK